MSPGLARLLRMGALALAVGLPLAALAAPAASVLSGPGVELRLGGAGSEQVSSAVKILLGLTVLSLAPAILMSMTSFIRIIVVLSLLRHALGTQETPPNTVLVSLALFLTLFTMSPVLHEVNTRSFQPYMQGKIGTEAAFEQGMKPFREFMLRQTREKDLALMIELSHARQPQSADEVGNAALIPAFMLSELRAAFQVGFVVFLPFLLIDLVVSTLLMSLGMMMVPPATISLPLKILMFVLIDGWSLVVRALLGTFK